MLVKLLKPLSSLSSRLAARRRTLRKHTVRRAFVERLERREVFANYVVLNTADSGPGSLREAIEFANGDVDADVIQFNLPTGSQTIQLQSTLTILEDLTITGPGAANLTINGGNEVSLFEIAETSFDTLTVRISGLTLQNGNASEGNGGAISNRGAELYVEDAVLRNNSGALGGAIYVLNELVSEDDVSFYRTAELYVSRTTFNGNSALYGGAIYNDRGHIEVNDGSSVVNNTADVDGGAFYTIGLSNSTDVNTTLLVNDSTVTGNSATNGSGGATYAENDHVEFIRSTVSNNQAALDGGAVFTVNTGSRPLESLYIEDSAFNANLAGDRGGAIYSLGDSVSLRDSSLLGNQATSGGAVYLDFSEQGFTSFSAFGTTFTSNLALGGVEQDGLGGAIYNSGNSFFVSDVVFANNQAIGGGGGGSGKGGAIYNDQYMEIRDTTFRFNSASVGNSQGGAIWSLSSFETPISFSYLTLSNNSAGEGGALYMDGSTFIENSTLDSNQALSGDGGAIWTSSTLQVYNSTIDANTATGNGGGIYVDFEETGTQIQSVTITDNRADADGVGGGAGGGLFTPGAERLINTIVAGNLVGTASARNDVQGRLQSLSSGNLISVNAGFTGAVNGSSFNQIGTLAAPIDPLLGPLANYGGKTRTRSLLNGSPALDNGNDEFVLFSDQRDDFIDDTFTTRRVGRVDIGAFERVFDFGDAAASYPVLASDNGARHEMTSNLYLGVRVDNEADGAPGANAGGDNFNALSDEDGIVFRFITADFMARAEVTASDEGLLSGWFDLNRDGDWDDAG